MQHPVFKENYVPAASSKFVIETPFSAMYLMDNCEAREALAKTNQRESSVELFVVMLVAVLGLGKAVPGPLWRTRRQS